jgi:hypothetical protein
MTVGEHIIFNRTRFQIQDVTHAMVENGGYLDHWMSILLAPAMADGGGTNPVLWT